MSDSFDLHRPTDRCDLPGDHPAPADHTVRFVGTWTLDTRRDGGSLRRITRARHPFDALVAATTVTFLALLAAVTVSTLAAPGPTPTAARVAALVAIPLAVLAGLTVLGALVVRRSAWWARRRIARAGEHVMVELRQDGITLFGGRGVDAVTWDHVAHWTRHEDLVALTTTDGRTLAFSLAGFPLDRRGAVLAFLSSTVAYVRL